MIVPTYKRDYCTVYNGYVQTWKETHISLAIIYNFTVDVCWKRPKFQIAEL